MAEKRINYPLICDGCYREIKMYQNYYEVAYMVCYCEKCYQEKYEKKDEQGEIRQAVEDFRERC